jgi:hypothetical protein
MKFSIGKKKDPLKEVEEDAARARVVLDEAEARRADLIERSAKTPVLSVENMPSVDEPEAMSATPAPVKLSKAQQAAVDALRVVLRDLEVYGGVFPDLGPSASAELQRTLLLACFAELRAIRAALEK